MRVIGPHLALPATAGPAYRVSRILRHLFGSRCLQLPSLPTWNVEEPRQLRRLGASREREDLAVSLWSMGGSVAIVVSIAMGLPPLSLALWPRMLVLSGAVGLVLTGTLKSRRLKQAREQELLKAGATAVTLADRIEVLEVQGLKYRRIPLRLQFVLMGGKAMIAGSGFWALRLIRHGTPAAVFLTGALAATAWLGWDILSVFRRRAGRERIDAEIGILLEGAAPALSAAQDEGEVTRHSENPVGESLGTLKADG